MKSLIHKSIALALSFLIMGATTSWTFSSHYCGSIRIDTVLFGHPEDCGMDMASLFERPTPPSDLGSPSSAEALAKPSCCHDLEELVAGQTVFKQLQTSFDFPWAATQLARAWEPGIALPSDKSPEISAAYTHPPPLGELPIYLLYRSIII